MQILALIYKYWKQYFLFVFFSVLMTTIFGLISQKWYKSTTSILPAERSDFLSSLTGLNSIVKNISPIKSLSSLTGNDQLDKYIAILKSNTLTKEVITQFDIAKSYDMEDEYYENISKQFLSNVEIEVQDEGNLTLSVLDTSRQRAAEIANYYIKRLDEINTKIYNSGANANRLFIEKRYNKNLKDIDSLENAVLMFQKKYGIISIPEQAVSSIKSVSILYAELYKAQIEYSIALQSFESDNPILVQSKLKMDELQKKIDQVNSGNVPGQNNVNVIIPYNKLPDYSNEYLKIYKNLEIQYALLEFITPLYEQAKVEEVRNTPTLIVLDKAVPAEKKSKPKLLIYMVIAFISSNLFGLFAIIFSEYYVLVLNRVRK
ncbi:MAG: hypothetical protein LCH54_06305 [Bacteroidetes bacterium]|nr:hypothetical protein [Bacteroidota bacterium]